MKILFKYMAQPFELFKKGYIRATQLSAINDPFEASYSEEGLKKLESEFEDVNLNGEQFLKDYIENNKNKIGIISFSESKDNLLMWAHYANEHKGLVAGFIYPSCEWKYCKFFEHLFLLPSLSRSDSERNIFFNGEIKPVMYRKQQRYKIDSFDFDYSNISIEGADRILYEIFLQKSEEWIYEKEHRIILKLEQADKVNVFDIEKIKNKHILAKILKSKYCKKKIEEQDKEYYIIELSEIHDDIERSVFARALAELSINPKNVYLFKLSPNSICYCIFGIKYNNERISFNYANKIGLFEIYKVKKNNKNYIIDFNKVLT